MISEKNSTNPESLTQFERGHCKRGRIPTESPRYIYIVLNDSKCKLNQEYSQNI